MNFERERVIEFGNFMYDYWWFFPLVFLLCCGTLFWAVSYEETRPGWRRLWESWTDYLIVSVWLLAIASLFLTSIAVFWRFK